MRLLLDEHIAPWIAETLRARGWDVVAVVERRDLRAQSDRVLVESMIGERRAIVTFDVVDFIAVARSMVVTGQEHPGIVLVAQRRFPSGGRDRRLVAALQAILEAHPTPDAFAGRVLWLESTTDQPDG